MIHSVVLASLILTFSGILYGNPVSNPLSNIQITISGRAAVEDVLKLLNQCPQPFFQLNSECFYYNENATSWQEAEIRCGSLGGRLAEPANVIQLVDALRKNFEDYSEIWIWIGGGKDTSSQTWSWKSGNPVFNWNSGQPDNREEENCLMISLGQPSPMYDYYCHEAYPFLCEY